MIAILPALVAVCSLSALPAIASAECAWVLWQETRDDRPAPGRDEEPASFVRGISLWEIHGAYATKETCQTKEEFLWPAVRARRKPVVTDGVVVALTRSELRCLPDTIDPRRRKGK